MPGGRLVLLLSSSYGSAFAAPHCYSLVLCLGLGCVGSSASDATAVHRAIICTNPPISSVAPQPACLLLVLVLILVLNREATSTRELGSKSSNHSQAVGTPAATMAEEVWLSCAATSPWQ